MKRTMNTRLLSLLCVLAIAVSLTAACGAEPAASDAPPPAATADSSAETPAATADSAAETPANEAEASAEPDGDGEAPVELSIFLDFTWMDTGGFKGIIPEEITRQTGVTLNPIEAVDEMQLGVLIASDDLPDLVYTEKLFDRLSNPNISYSYNELIEKYAPGFQPNEMQKTVATSYGTDGNYYTVLNAASSEEEWHAATAGSPTIASVIYRKDIAEELGMYPIETLDEYLAAMAEVKVKYPEMVPLTMEYTFMDTVFKQWFLDGWFASEEEFLMENGNRIVHVTEQPQYKEFLKFTNNLFLNGYINPDNFAFTDGTQSEELCMTDKAFSMSHMTGDIAERMTRGLNSNGFEGEFEHTMPLTDSDYGTPGTGWAGVFITKNNKNPEKSIQMMEWMFTEEGQKITQWGREGIEYTLNPDGTPAFSQEWIDAGVNNTATEIYNPNFYFGISGVVEAVGRGSNLNENAKALATEIRSRLKVVTIPQLVLPKGETDEKIKLDQIVDVMKNGQTKITLSADEDEFNANVQELYDRLEQIGLPQLTEYLNNEAKAKGYF